MLLLFYDVEKNHYDAWNYWPTHRLPQKEISHFHHIHFRKNISPGYDKFLQDTQSIGSPVINPFN